jgi:hypothetical protein
MAWSVEERQKLRQDLAKHGIRGDYLAGWPDKVDCWRHPPWYNNVGKVVKPAGTFVPNQPGIPDSVLRLARRGVLPTPPSESCSCKACRERDWSLTRINSDAEDENDRHQLFDITQAVVEGRQCGKCDYVTAEGKNPQASLAAHSRYLHPKVSRKKKEAVTA